MTQRDKRAEEKGKSKIRFRIGFGNRTEWQSKGSFRVEKQIRQGTKLTEEGRLRDFRASMIDILPV